MIKKSLVQNYIFNLIKTLSSLLFPIITFTYSSRVLGVDGVGQVNFAKSIISYFSMIAILGMNFYGTREAAKVRDDKGKLSKFTQEMLIINSCTTVLAYILLAAAIFMVPKFRGYKALLLVNSIAILLQGIGMEWLYQALEEYRYIAVRSIFFQIGALAAMFLFVRDENDVLPYAVVTLAASSGSYVLNFINARKYISFRHCPHYEIKKHLRPILWLFAMAVSIELYTVLDSTMLGFLKGDTAVGLYTAAIKVNKMVITLITAMGAVLIPRLSYYIGSKKYGEVGSLIKKAYNYVFLLSVPAAVGLFMLSKEIILLFSGSKFISAGLTMRIMTPIVLFIPFSVMTNQQTFVPLGKEKLILLSTSVGAVTNFALNMLLIPRYAENGAATATVLAEAAVAVVCLINANRYFRMKEIFEGLYQYILAVLPTIFMFLVSRLLPLHVIVQVFITIAVSGCSYLAILKWFKNQYFLEVEKIVRARLDPILLKIRKSGKR